MTIRVKTVKYYLRMVGARGLISAIRSKITGAQIELEVTRQEIKFPFYLRIPSSDIPTYEQVFINQEYDFDVRTSPKVIIDAGANVGLASIYFSNRFTDAKIYSIEPEESNFELLKKNVFPYKNIIPIRGALWNENKEINLVDPGLGKWGFMTQGDNAKEEIIGEKRNRIQGMTVDEVMTKQGIDFIDILKIDIEGAEREVFNDASLWIGKVGALIVELHERMKSGCNRSFYNATNDFDEEWCQGEHVYLARNKGCLTRRLPEHFSAAIQSDSTPCISYD